VIVTVPGIPMLVIRLDLFLTGRNGGRAALRRALRGRGDGKEAGNPGSGTQET